MTGSKSPSKRRRYTRQADILAYALINDSPAVMGLDRLSPAIQADIVIARLKGYHPVSVRWQTGEFALMLCEPGTNMPPPEKILEAYYQCRQTNKTFPKGTLS
jgi:hypothetical protein